MSPELFLISVFGEIVLVFFIIDYVIYEELEKKKKNPR